MINIIYKPCISEKELKGILELQNKNHYSSLTSVELNAEGFLTCTHSLELLKDFNKVAPYIIALCNNKVVGYLLTMTAVAEIQIPFLEPMFNEFRNLKFQEKTISDYKYLIVGQVCLARNFRGQGVLGELYDFYIKTHANKFDFAITEIATRNKPSLNAHKKK